MTPEKIRCTIESYRKYFTDNNIPAEKQDHGIPIASSREVLAHCHGMLDEMLGYLDEGRTEKVFRWLGFIQGCLWSSGKQTISELKNHNRLSEL